MQMHSPVHPGTILREYMGESTTVSNLARQTDVSESDLSTFLDGNSTLTDAMASRFSAVFPSSKPEMWLALQKQFDTANPRRS